MGWLSKILGVDLANSGPSPVADPDVEGGPRTGTLESRIEAVLESVRPALHRDGGDVKLVAVVGNSARVRLIGACDGCPSAAMTLRFGIEEKLRQAIPEFEDLIPV